MPKINDTPIKGQIWNFIRANDSVTDLYIYDDIQSQQSFDPQTYTYGSEVTSKDFLRDLRYVDTPEIRVHINSAGGDAFEAVAIGQGIKDARTGGKKITCQIDGVCASAAVTVAVACEKVYIPANAYMMIHDPVCIMCGMYSESNLTSYAERVATVKRGIVAAYAEKTGKPERTIIKAMSAETWMDGAEAVAEGYADELLETPAAMKVVEDAQNHVVNIAGAVMSMSVFDKAPDALKKIKTLKEDSQLEIKNLEDLRKAYPDIVNQVETDARTAGANDERERLKSLDEVAGAVPLDMLNQAKYETFAGAKDVLFDAAKTGKLVNQSVVGGMAADAAIVNQVPGVVNTGAAGMTKAQTDVAIAEKAAKSIFDKMRK